MLYALTLNSLRLAKRQKISLPLFMVLSAVLPYLSYWLFSADGTLLGVLRVMWHWQFYLSALLLMFFTAYLSVVILASELREQQIINTVAKPVSRLSIMIAKILAVIMLATFLLLISAVSSYYALSARAEIESVIKIRAQHPETIEFDAAQRHHDAQQQITIVNRDLFTARQKFLPAKEVSSFVMNWARAWFLLWIRLLMLAIIGVSCVPIMNANVSAFVMMTIIFNGLVTTLPSANESNLPHNFIDLIRDILRYLPNFSETNPMESISNALEISWWSLGKQIGRDIIVRSGLVFMLGYYAFRRRELAVYHPT